MGVGVRKALPGAVLVATPGTSPLGVEPRWQFSHLVELGTCEPAPGPPSGGITTILLTPKKLLPVMLGPWHVSQSDLMPLWLNCPFAKVTIEPLAPDRGTGVAGILLT